MVQLNRKPEDVETTATAAGDPEPPVEKQSRLKRELVHTFSALSVHDFRILWFGMLFTMGAFQISIVARSWLAYDLTGSAVWLGIVAVARGLPQLALAPLGGVAADRLDKRTLLIVTQIMMAILNLIIAVLVQFHWIQIWHLVVLGVIQGCIFPFMMPTRTAYISDLVVDDRLPNALALDSTGRNLNRVVAPTLAGFLIAISPMISFYAVAIFFVCSAATLLILPKPEKKVFRSKGAFNDMASGFKYIAERPTLIMLIAMALMFTLLGMPYSQLLPVFQKSVFHVGATDLGFMYTAVGIGAVIGSLTSAYVADSPRKRLYQIIVGTIFGIALALFAISPNFVASLPFLLVAGGMIEAYFTLNRVLLVLNTDRDMFGRVISIYSMSWALVPVALLAMGPIVDAFGAPLTVACAGSLLAVSILALVVFVPDVRRVGASGH